MIPAKSACAKELHREIETTPEEYLQALLEVLRGFRHGILLKPADESFRQGIKEALEGDTLPISELCDGMDAG